jgi:hypothetical protein
VLGQNADSALATFFFGSRYDSTPEARTIVNVVQVKDGVKVYARGEMVTNPGSAFEHVTDLTGAAGDTLQKTLEGVRDDLTPVSVARMTESALDKSNDISQQKSISNNDPAPSQGTLSYDAEKLAIQSGCIAENGARPTASLLQNDAGLELYDIKCKSGHMMVRCEHRICQLMK